MDDARAWDEPGVERVADGVHRIPLPLPNDGLRAVNVYVIDDDGDGLVLVDAGWALAESQQQLERGLAEIEHKLSDIRLFLVTHAHRDHYTQAVAVRRQFGSTVKVGLGERDTITALGDPNRHRFEQGFLRLLASGAGVLAHEIAAAQEAMTGREHLEWEQPDEWLTSGPIALHGRTLEAIETPGHTIGHLVYHDAAAAMLFAGDHVLPSITPSIGLELRRQNELPLAQYLDSLRLVRAMPDARLLPAHGPVTDSVHARVEELLAHHERRLTQSAEAVRAGNSTAFEVATVLRWTRRERAFADLNLFNQGLAVFETKVHLDVCVVRGWLTDSTDADGIIRYQAA